MLASETRPEQTKDVMASDEPVQYRGPDRRKSPRAPLHWNVCMRCDNDRPAVRSRTHDISRDGLFCVVDQEFVVGQRLTCDIDLPTYATPESGGTVCLRCRVQIVRVDAVATTDGDIGLGLRIEDYRVLTLGRHGRNGTLG
jgi:PilZ domain